MKLLLLLLSSLWSFSSATRRGATRRTIHLPQQEEYPHRSLQSGNLRNKRMMMMNKMRMMMMMKGGGGGGGGTGNPWCATCSSGFFYDGCNNCFCDNNGNAACTRRACEDYEIGFPFCRSIKKEISCQTCPEGFYTPDGCNECTCTDYGTSVCTNRDDCPDNANLQAACLSPSRVDCSLVRCADPNCEALGKVDFTRPGECCPTCVTAPDSGRSSTEPSCTTCASGNYYNGCNWCTCDPISGTEQCETVNTCVAPEDYDDKRCEPKSVYCTAEVYTCSDGTEVGRDYTNDCEFFACPDSGGFGEDEIPGATTCNGDQMVCPNGQIVGRNPLDLCNFSYCPP